jgi:hypothetical protein
LLRKGNLKMSAQFYSAFRNDAQRSFDTEQLLVRYPRLDERELARLIENFPSLSPVDRAVMAADAQLSDQLALFYHDHRRALEMPLTPLLLLLIVPLITASAVLLWLFDG